MKMKFVCMYSHVVYFFNLCVILCPKEKWQVVVQQLFTTGFGVQLPLLHKIMLSIPYAIRVVV